MNVLKDITDREFVLIRDYIKKNFGISLGDEKKSLIYSRLRNILLANNLEDFTQYYEFLVNDKSGEAVVQFIDKVTTNHTFFMRETDHFDFFRDKVLPDIYERYNSTHDLRLWCAGCSSGEESYTLQMIIQDFFNTKQPKWDTQILATDISTNVLNKAINGIYPTESIATLPPKWQNDYFDKSDSTNSVVKDSIKKQIIYRKFNLMQEHFSFKKKFQVIFCRNVMIYFDDETRTKLINKFYDITESNGYLFIGHSESISRATTQYKYVMPAVYKRL